MLAAIYGLDRARRARRIDELAELLDAADLFDLPVRSLSLGQRMRCELAACMLHEPDILFLDEPTIGLDLLAKQRFRELLVRLNERAGHDDLPDVARRRRHRARRPAGHRRQPRRGHLRRRRRRHAPHPARHQARRGRPARAGRRPLPAGVRVVEHTDTVLRLVVDTTRRSSGRCSTSCSTALRVADISVVDPPLEQVIAEIYARRPR